MPSTHELLPPNIIVVLTDDQGFGQLPVFSDCFPDDMLFLSQTTPRYACDPQKVREAARTCMPRLQRLAGDGVIFRNAFVTSPVCAPSRCALITGRYQQRVGVVDNVDRPPPSAPFRCPMMTGAAYGSGWRLTRGRCTP